MVGIYTVFTHSSQPQKRRSYEPSVKIEQDASKTRRREYPDGSLLCVNEQGARSDNAVLRRVFSIFLDMRSLIYIQHPVKVVKLVTDCAGKKAFRLDDMLLTETVLIGLFFR